MRSSLGSLGRALRGALSRAASSSTASSSSSSSSVASAAPPASSYRFHPEHFPEVPPVPLALGLPVYFALDRNINQVLNPRATDAITWHVEEGTDLPPIVMIVYDELPLVHLLDADGNIDESRFRHPFDARARQLPNRPKRCSAAMRTATKKGEMPIGRKISRVGGFAPGIDDG